MKNLFFYGFILFFPVKMQVKTINFKKSQLYKVSFVQYELVTPSPSPASTARPH